MEIAWESLMTKANFHYIIELASIIVFTLKLDFGVWNDMNVIQTHIMFDVKVLLNCVLTLMDFGF